jgi:hypothetical protein
MSFNRDLRQSPEVLRVWRYDDVHILRSSDHTPGVDREAPHEHEVNGSLGESAKKLIEGRFGQLRRAAPVNRIS